MRREHKGGAPPCTRMKDHQFLLAVFPNFDGLNPRYWRLILGLAGQNPPIFTEMSMMFTAE